MHVSTLFCADTDDEAREVPKEEMEIIEFPAILLDATGGIMHSSLAQIDRFHTYVRPTIHPKLTAFCTELTVRGCHRIAVPRAAMVAAPCCSSCAPRWRWRWRGGR